MFYFTHRRKVTPLIALIFGKEPIDQLCLNRFSRQFNPFNHMFSFQIMLSCCRICLYLPNTSTCHPHKPGQPLGKSLDGTADFLVTGRSNSSVWWVVELIIMLVLSISLFISFVCFGDTETLEHLMFNVDFDITCISSPPYNIE